MGNLLWIAGLAAAIHLDWHLSRPHHHAPLSGEWPLHWVIAVPLFAALGLYVWRRAPGIRVRSALLVIGGGVLVGQGLEPLWEYLTDGAEAVPGFRWTAFFAFMAAGLLSFAAVLVWCSGAQRSREAGGAADYHSDSG